MRCTFCNRNWLQFTGLTLDEAMAGGIWNGLHPDDAARGKAAFVAAHEAPRSYSIEYRQRHHDGDYRWLLETGCPLRDDSGAFAGLVGSAVDITDLKHAEARLETRTRELELSNRALDQFAAVAAHDLRTPLRHVLQFAELLREEYRERLGSDASDYADNIVMAVHRMRGIVSSLLELARIPVSAAHDGFAAFALHDAVAMAHANVGKDALELTCDETLPQVCGAQGLITQLLQNLFDNAVKYHGAGQPHAHVSAWHESGMLLVAVTDDGVGMAHQHGEMTVSSVAPGNGIGLPLCRRIAELHGGDVWIDADHTPGTRVCFSVKAA
jgi:two-component system CheB/CheR fusion protein